MPKQKQGIQQKGKVKEIKQEIIAVNNQRVGAAKYPIITNRYIVFSDEPYIDGVTDS